MTRRLEWQQAGHLTRHLTPHLSPHLTPHLTRPPEVSVVLICLNTATTIGAALDSLLVAFDAAGAVNHELIVIDGGSSDVTVELVKARCSEFNDFTFRPQASTGYAAARNEGIAFAKAPLLAFCDADDAWTRDSLTHRLSALHQHPEAWAVSGEVRFCAQEGKSDPEANITRRRPGSDHPGYTPGALLVRRSALDRIGTFDETLRIGADSDWILRAMQVVGPPVIVPHVVLEKGLRAGSLSTDVAAYRKDMQIIARRFIERHRSQTRT